MSTPAAKRAQVAERRARAVELRTQRHTWQEIADLLGYPSRAAACNDVSRALGVSLAGLDESVAMFRQVELDHLDELARRCWHVLESSHPLVSHGRVVCGNDGQPLEDPTPVLGAVDRLLRIADARCRLLGLYGAVQVEAGVSVRYEVAGVDLGALR